MSYFEHYTIEVPCPCEYDPVTGADLDTPVCGAISTIEVTVECDVLGGPGELVDLVEGDDALDYQKFCPKGHEWDKADRIVMDRHIKRELERMR